MASVDNFVIKVDGVSAHGTQPHLGVDALLAAAAIVSNIQSFVSRTNDPLNPLVVISERCTPDSGIILLQTMRNCLEPPGLIT